MKTSSDAALAALVEQACAEGVGLVTLRALVEEASERGALRALAQLRLHDDLAVVDIMELRQLLAAWRDAKRAASRAFIGWIARLLAVALLVGIAVKLRLVTLGR